MIALLLIVSVAAAAPVPKPVPPSGRYVFRLQNLSDEFEMLIKNERSERSDVRRQEREMAFLRVYDRIPLKTDLPGLRRQLANSSKAAGIQFLKLDLIKRSPSGAPVPRSVRSDKPRFRFSEEQLVETLEFEMKVSGKEEGVKKWLEALPDDLLRLVDTKDSSLKMLRADTWSIRARTFRFRQVQFPKIIPPDPRALENSPPRSDPVVAEWIRRADELRLRAAPLYAIRARILLNSARLSFYASKTVN
ncbi:MAG: hypothetical protein A2X94_16905 [Bdellovibrionales bacterium GWB1_55_8]|nr:MAG: hypothetical protein A2X94_16905 [Bdellovibrionales bacterium GWB1_55_8]